MDAPRFPTTKIQPPRSRAVRVERPLLDATVTEALLDCRLVLLQAPGGFGKTSTLAAQLARLPAGTALAWVSMDEDDDPRRLLACLAAALEPHDLPWRTSPEALVAQLVDDGVTLRRAVAELVNALAGAEAPRGVIVLDDLHRVALAPTHAMLDALIARLPPKWTLVLSTRVAPPLALARMRVAGELAEFTQDDLRFNAGEAAALAGAEASAAARERVDELFERTQGWPAGLQLCLAAMRTRPGAAGGLAADSGARMDRHLFEYLATEVLDDMPAALHDFLVRCSVLPELTAARAAAVSGDARAAERLDEIEARGLFVTALEAHERTLVLHDLFRDALHERLRRRFADELPQLLKRAAAGETDPLRRVGYLLRADDWAGAEAALVAAAPELFLGGGGGEVQRLVAQFEPAWRNASPRLLRLAGIAACLRWQWTEMARCMEDAAQAAAAAGDTAERQLAQAYLALAVYPLGRNAQSETLIAQLRDPAQPPLNAVARRVMLMADANQRFRRGEHAELPGVFAEVMDSLEAGASLYDWWECVPANSWATVRGMRLQILRYVRGALARLGDRALPMRGEVQIKRALAELWSGRLDNAAREAERAEADMHWLACSAEMEISVELFRVIEAGFRGRRDEVARRLDTLFVREDSSTEERRSLWLHQVAIYGVRVTDAIDGDPATLRRWAAHLLERPLEDPSSDNARAVATRARYAAAQGRWADAMPLFDHLLPRADHMDVNGQAIELRLRCAHARLRCDRLDDAADAARPALQRMRDEDERGHALMCGVAVLAALAEAPWEARLAPELQDELRAVARLAAELRVESTAAAPADRAKQPSAPAASADSRDDGLLSSREREVLERIAAGDSNKLIARALDISPHTVKRHVANILDKLGLESRGQASAWLREHA
ncbi:LuxR C-terminal-related transcriptional regulator [Rhizobacter sp. Root404]|uniref:helix-turn-helix transcriptional regulator n=1 Tax=Rhizobacter sp. Root404 TaxID=1736528 RepID=UPI0006F42854|nr:LuxR C-terminal-related transcriptional regulator [Rhizobacter sp. Root404]KQW39968.1 hypothetical protein ASC76_00440 [Rhizobacter sp. Root404]